MQRFQVIDTFRGIAILSVMLYHYTKTYRIHDPAFEPVIENSFGYLGVHFFFIISGFVIFLTLEHCSSPATFLYKRFSRLYPTFWFCMLTTFTVYQFFPLPNKENIGIPEVLGNLTMIPGFFNIPRVDGAYWSLVPEFFFYAAMAFLFLFRRHNPWVWWGVIVLVLTWANRFLFHIEGPLVHLVNIFWGSLFFAGILFYLLMKQRTNKLIHVLIALSLVTTCINLRDYQTWLAMSAVYGLFYLFVYDKLNWLALKPLVFIGKISFPLYLLHQDIGYCILIYTGSLVPEPNIRVLVACCMMIALAYLVHRYIELPSIRLLRRRLGGDPETKNPSMESNTGNVYKAF